jgi:GNAT superfamily N-acetyltransferase
LSSYSPNISKIFVAKSGNKELGFMRLSNHFWNESSDDSNWNISEVYVKPPYRSANVATKLMKYAITKQSAKSIFLETERYEKKKEYFNALGLTDCFSFDSTLSYVFVEGFKEDMYEKFMAHIDKSEHKNEASK